MTGAEKLPKGPRPKVAARPGMTHGYGYPFVDGWVKTVKEKDQLISEMLAVLKELEWAGMANVRGDRCPVCLIPWQPPGNPNPAHQSDCKLARLIKQGEAVVG